MPNTGKSLFLFRAGTGLFYLGLSLIIGGMIAVGAFTAPVLFQYFPKIEAARVMARIFQQFDIVLITSTTLLFFGELLRTLPYEGFWGKSILQKLRFILLCLLILLILYSTLHINPSIAEMQNEGLNPSAIGLKSPERLTAFAKTHQLAEILYEVEIFIALLLLFLTPFVHRGSRFQTIPNQTHPQSELGLPKS